MNGLDEQQAFLRAERRTIQVYGERHGYPLEGDVGSRFPGTVELGYVRHRAAISCT